MKASMSMNLFYLEIANVLILALAFMIIITSIIINFFEAQNQKKVKKERKNIVETGTMAGFFLFLYLVIRFRIGILENFDIPLRVSLMVAGWIIIAIGVYFNVSGRFKLGTNWANQIRIYKNQSLVTGGVYSQVRHPLYASLIWMFYAVSLIYLNWLAFLLNSFIFIPFMYYRARQEEKLLMEEFKKYKQYKQEVGMFFPKIKW